jgi:hypothetical protein
MSDGRLCRRLLLDAGHALEVGACDVKLGQLVIAHPVVTLAFPHWVE